MLRKTFVAFAAVSCLINTQVIAKENTPDNKRYESIELFNKVMHLIETQYYRDVDSKKLIEGALNGMMETLDPHSNFLDKEVFQKMQEDTQGEFGGLGIEVSMKDGVLVIVTPIEDSPAWKAGIKAGDRIVEINHESMVGVTLDQAIDKMRGKLKSKVILGIMREGVEGVRNFEITREMVQLKAVKSELVKNQFIYLRLSQFQKNSAEQLIAGIKELKKQAEKNGGLKGIVLDLRSNPGGLLDEAVEVSSIFLKDGIVVSTEGRDPKNKEIRYVKKSGFKDLDTPMAILINGSSASASEIVSGALQDHKRALIMGTNSFGKGSVQSVVKLNDEIGLKLTIAQYMTPAGRKIQATGIVPDITIDEVDSNWLNDHRKISMSIRERDLKNHLTATIETADEKKAREEREKIERQQRAERFLEMKQNKKSKEAKSDLEDEEGNKKVEPKDDFQVLQAINYLSGFNIIKSINH